MRETLVAALVACAKSFPSRWRTRRFVTGLSSDELQFIAQYLGSRILGSPDELLGIEAGRVASRDQEHKLILLREFLGRTGIVRDFTTLPTQTPMRAQTSRWN